MVSVKLYKTIGSEDDNLLAELFGMPDQVFSVESIDELFAANPDETDFTFNINSAGGSVAEGLLIYDRLRTSGKNIYMNIDGACHSMAVTLLLAAPLENRTANRNARALVHKVYTTPMGVSLSADDLKAMQEDIEREQNAILDIYADRTGTDRAVLEGLMQKEGQLSAEQLLEHGFISKINSYNTNKKPAVMSKETRKGLLDRLFNFQKEVNALLNEQDAPVNYDFKDADGNVLFSTENEDDSLAVNDKATPDGSHELPDGRKVVVTNGAISEILEPVGEEDGESEELANALERIEALENQLRTANELITNMRNEFGSSYTPPARAFQSGKNKKPAALSAEDYKAEIRENRNLAKKGGRK